MLQVLSMDLAKLRRVLTQLGLPTAGTLAKLQIRWMGARGAFVLAAWSQLVPLLLHAKV